VSYRRTACSIYSEIARSKKNSKERRASAAGQALTQKFPVLHYGRCRYLIRYVGFSRLRPGGRREALDVDEFNRLPRRQMKLDIHCVTRWSKFDTVWEGVHLKDLIDQGFIRPSQKRHS